MSDTKTPSHIPDGVKYVIGIDFGTSRSGFSWCRANKPDEIFIPQEWDGCSQSKTLTHIFTQDDSNLTTIAFGELAQEAFGAIQQKMLEDEKSKDSKKKKGKEKLNFNDIDSKAAELAAYEVPPLYFEKFKLNLLSNVVRFSSAAIPMIRCSNRNVNREVESTKVVASALLYIKKFAFRIIQNTVVSPVSFTEVMWILTVPAIYDEFAKSIMLNAAQVAGLPASPRHILLALEPEAASLACFIDCGIDSSNYPKGTTYMILDCGGGTIDSVVHRTDGKGGVDSVIAPGGGSWGSTFIEKFFIENILANLINFTQKKLLAKEIKLNWEEYCQLYPADVTKLMMNFDALKAQTDVNTSVVLSLPVPQSLIDYVTSKQCSLGYLTDLFNSKNLIWNCSTTILPPIYVAGQGVRLQLQWDSHINAWIVPLPTMYACFGGVLIDIVTHVSKIIHEVQDLRFLFLVGGFGSSPLLKAAIAANIPSTILLQQPKGGSTAILKGAVMYGCSPTKVIQSRPTPWSYGYKSLALFDASKHMHLPRVQAAVGGPLLVEVFTPFIRKGQTMSVVDPIKTIFTPSAATQSRMTLEIFRSPNRNAEFLHDAGMEKIGTVEFAMPGVERGADRRFEVSIMFLPSGNVLTGGGPTVILNVMDADTKAVVADCRADFQKV